MTDIDLKFIVAGALLVVLMLVKFLAGNEPMARTRRRQRRPWEETAKAPEKGADAPTRTHEAGQPSGGAALADTKAAGDAEAASEAVSEAERAFFHRQNL